MGTLRRASIRCLRDAGFVANTIRRAGLAFDGRGVYGRDDRHMNRGPFGLWQTPAQLGRCLVELSHYQIGSMIEIGTWSGWTITLVGAYLLRFNPGLRITTVDIGHCWGLRDRLLVPMRVHTGTSADFQGEGFDLAFIDGDHGYAACAADYENVGRRAAICAFHDINDRFVAAYAPNQGGVPRLWAELRSGLGPGERAVEYLAHPSGDRVMGIGLILRPSATAQAKHGPS